MTQEQEAVVRRCVVPPQRLQDRQGCLYSFGWFIHNFSIFSLYYVRSNIASSIQTARGSFPKTMSSRSSDSFPCHCYSEWHTRGLRSHRQFWP